MRSIVIRLGALCAATIWALSAHAGDEQVAEADSGRHVSVSRMELFPGSDNAPAKTDGSRLTRIAGLITVEVRTSGLDPSGPYSLWAVVFNNPARCHSSPCSDADLPITPGHDPLVEAALINIGGGVSLPDGRGVFRGRLPEARNGVVTADLQFGPGLLDAQRAEVHIVVRGHGQPAEADLFSALRSFEGGCNANNKVQPPCGNQQVSVHVVK